MINYLQFSFSVYQHIVQSTLSTLHWLLIMRFTYWTRSSQLKLAVWREEMGSVRAFEKYYGDDGARKWRVWLLITAMKAWLAYRNMSANNRPIGYCNC